MDASGKAGQALSHSERTESRSVAAGGTVRISALVPARNEEQVIAACVRSLVEQPEVAEIVVVNDQSTDRTAEIVRALAAGDARVRLTETDGVPAGWVGKNNAVWTGAKETKGGEWLLFVDADAELAEGAVRRALEIAAEAGAALVSFSPQQELGSWQERALIPFVYCRLARHFSYAEVNDPGSRAAAANGQFLMIRRDAYEAVGGHASVASEVLEDVALAKRVKAAGYKLWFGPGRGVVRARMYRSFGEMWQGWSKNLYLLVGGKPIAVYRELLSVIPWIALLLILLGLRFPLPLVAGLGLLLARQAAYGRALQSNGFARSLILYYVPGLVLYSAVLWSSYRAHWRGRVRWKGRELAVGSAERDGGSV